LGATPISTRSFQGCQIFIGPKIPKLAKYTKLTHTIPNGHKIYQQRLLQGAQKFTQIGIFGLKIYHLATLILVPGAGLPDGTFSNQKSQFG
jgi:hypothetical protein